MPPTPTSATYDYYYMLSSTAPTSGYTVPNFNLVTLNSTLRDTNDASEDGNLAPNAGVEWSASFSTITYYGQTDAGDPIVFNVDYSLYYLLSNRDDLRGTQVGFNQSTYTMCFAPGTGIATPQGDVAVETLTLGDRVLTADGRAVPVLWIGHQTVATLVGGTKVEPVRIAAGALGNGLPTRDLVVTADHGMVVDGLLINASALVNGDSIRFVPRAELPEFVTYYHIETEAHEVILAEGAAAESFADVAGRKTYANYAQYLDHFGVDRLIPEMDLKRITSARLLPTALRMRLGIDADSQQVA